MANPVVTNVVVTRDRTPSTTVDLELTYNYSGDYDERGSLIYWYKDGVRQGTLDSKEQVTHGRLRVGDIWYAAVRPRDTEGQLGSWVVSASVLIEVGTIHYYRGPGAYPHRMEPGIPVSASVSASSSSCSSSSCSSSFSSSCSSSFSSSSSCSSSFSSSSSCSSSFSSSCSSSFSSSSCSSSFSSSSSCSSSFSSSSSCSSSFSSSSSCSSSFSSSSSSFSSSSLSFSLSSSCSSSFSSSSSSLSCSSSSFSSSSFSSGSTSFSSSSFSSSSSSFSSGSSSFSSSCSSSCSSSFLSTSSSSSSGAGPLLQVVPTDLDFWFDEPSLQITITNIGGGTLNWTLAGVPAYLTPDISFGSLGPSDSDVVTFTADRSGLTEGLRYYDSFDVNSNDGNQAVTTHIMRVYSWTCAEIEALNKNAMVEDVQPVDAATRGDATYYPATSFTGLFQPGRGGWNVTINGTDTTNMVAFAVQTKMWIPFVTGTQFQLSEQTSFDMYIESVLRENVTQGEVWYVQYAYRSGAWEFCTEANVSCSAATSGSITLAPGDSISGLTKNMPRWEDIFATGGGAQFQGDPYFDAVPRGVCPSDLWSALDEWALDGGYNVIPKPTGNTIQTAPPRAAAGSGEVPLHYHALPGGPADPYVIEANGYIDNIWNNLPGISFTDGRIGFTAASGANWSYRGNWLNWNAVAQGLSRIFHTTLAGGGMYIDMSGGEEGQVVELRISNNPYMRWFVVGMINVYEPNEPYGYLVADYVGYATPPATVPGSTDFWYAEFNRHAAFWWGTNVTGPAGSAGVQPIQVLSNPGRVVLKKVGSNWVVQYIEDLWLINAAKNAIIPVSY